MNEPRKPWYKRAAICVVFVASLAIALGPLQGGEDAGPSFHLTLDAKVSKEPFWGRVFVVASRQPIKDEPPRLSWFTPEPFFAMDVTDWKPGAALEFGRQALGYPDPLAKLPPGKYHVQAVADMDMGGQNCLTSPGNLYSKPMLVELPQKTGPVRLTIDQVLVPRKFQETERVKLVEIESPLLSKFHGRPMKLRAGVVLPKSFAKNPAARYPVVYEIPGFGGDHFGALAVESRKVEPEVDMIWVVLDPSCRLGHHVFADSDNNGPCGKALVTELIPHIEKVYRGQATPAARFVTGHSSGGWSSLWLQITYPDFFGGVWSTAPDPVDFRDFQKVNIYATGTSVFTDEMNKPRPLAFKKDKILLWFKAFSDFEEVMGRGGQLGSFEAVFSSRSVPITQPTPKTGKWRTRPGRPMRLWDRKTGIIDIEVAKTWQRYDINLILERDWPRLAPMLTGKLHVFMGDEDTFYLTGATLMLKENLKRLGSDAVVEIVPGRDHFTLLGTALRQRIAREMSAKVRKGQGAKMSVREGVGSHFRHLGKSPYPTNMPAKKTPGPLAWSLAAARSCSSILPKQQGATMNLRYGIHVAAKLSLLFLALGVLAVLVLQWMWVHFLDPYNTVPMEHFSQKREAAFRDVADAPEPQVVVVSHSWNELSRDFVAEVVLVNPLGVPLHYYGYTMSSWQSRPALGSISPFYQIQVKTGDAWKDASQPGRCGTGAGQMLVRPRQAGTFLASISRSVLDQLPPPTAWKIGVGSLWSQEIPLE